jgi:two-component system, cell cycle sensor histidine kinase and response regulator CckA
MEPTILVVEDSPTQAERLRFLLEEEGYRVELARNGTEGLEKARSRPPELIISDVIMPGMDGYDFCSAVKASASTRLIPFILFTERHGPADVIEGLLRGADNFIPKSSPDDYLLERVRRIFEQLEHRGTRQLSVNIMVRVGEREVSVSADKQQMFELLLASIEETGRVHQELKDAQQQLERHAQDLEAEVEKRTREVSETQARLRLLLDSTAEAIYGLDLEGRCTFCNPACVRLLGYDQPGAIVGSRMHPLTHPRRPDGTVAPEEQCPICLALRGGEGIHVAEGAFWRADGSSFPVECWSYPMRRDGALVGAVVTFLDSTDKKRLESQLLQSQKMESVGRLAGGVAHDFNNLLTVIIGYGDLLVHDLGPGHRGLGRLEEIRQAAGRASSLTRQLLAFSRKQMLEPKVLDLNAVVADVERMLRRLIGEDVQFVTVSGSGLGRVRADPGQVEQVIVNLAVNARDAMPTGGRLIVETRNVDLDESYARERPDARPGRHVLLAVSDTGHGMDAETLSHAFEPFFTTREPGKGTGLGLATVYGIVRQSGGHVTIYSEPGRGTTCKVYLPRIDEEQDDAPAAPALAAVPPGTETILLVEDEAALLTLTREVLESAGYRVIEGSTPEEALAAAAAHAEPIHLVLTDVVLPRLSGRQLVEALRSSRPEARVLFTSGYTDDVISHHGLLEPGVNFLQKPFTGDDLLRKLRDILG